ILFRPRASATLPHDRAQARGSVVLLHSDRPDRGAAMARRAWLRRSPRLAGGRAERARLFVAAVRARLGSVCVSVLQRLGLEAALVHPADFSPARAGHGLAAGSPRATDAVPARTAAR